MRAFSAHLRLPPSRGAHVEISKPSPSTPPTQQQQQATIRPSGAKERKVASDKRKQPAEDPVLESPLVTEPSGFMAASRVEARVEESHQRR